MIESEAIGSVLPIFGIINPLLSETVIRNSLTEMYQQGYRCAVAHNGIQCIGIIGMWIQTKFYVGKHIEYDNFFVKPSFRGYGIGKALLEFVNAYAKEQGCIAAELTCDVMDEPGKVFWKENGFTMLGYRYQRTF